MVWKNSTCFKIQKIQLVQSLSILCWQIELSRNKSNQVSHQLVCFSLLLLSLYNYMTGFMKMTRFMKTVLMKSAFLYTKWAAHFDFTTPKGLKITPNDQEKVEEYKMENKRVREKRLTFLWTFISSLGPEKTLDQGEIFINTVFINPLIYTWKTLKQERKRNQFQPFG